MKTTEIRRYESDLVSSKPILFGEEMDNLFSQWHDAVAKSSVSSTDDGTDRIVSGQSPAWVDSFTGSVLDPQKWEVEEQVGTMTYSVNGSGLVVDMGVDSGSRLSLLSKGLVTLPADGIITFQMSQALDENEFFFELVEVDPETFIPVINPNLAGDWRNRVSIRSAGSNGTTVYLQTLAQGSNYITEIAKINTGYNSRQSSVDYRLMVRPQWVLLSSIGGNLSGSWYYAARITTQVPDPNKLYRCRLRFLNVSAPPSATTVTIQRVNLINAQVPAVEVASGRGDVNGGQGIPVQGYLLTGSAVFGAVDANNETITYFGSAAITTYTVSTTTKFRPGGVSQFIMPVTAVSGSGAFLDVIIQESSDDGVTWTDLWHYPRITSAGVYRTPPLMITGSCLRLLQTVGGTSASFTRSFNRSFRRFDFQQATRNFYDRAIDPNVLNSATPWFEAPACGKIDASVMLSNAGSPTAQFALEASDDKVLFTRLGTLAAVSSTFHRFTLDGTAFKFYRIRTVSAGTGVVIQPNGVRVNYRD